MSDRMNHVVHWTLHTSDKVGHGVPASYVGHGREGSARTCCAVRCPFLPARLGGSTGELTGTTDEALAHADEALDDGWGVATVVWPGDVPKGTSTPKGRRVVQCPATADGSRVDCNGCGGKRGPLCAPSAKRSPFVIALPDHGPQAGKGVPGCFAHAGRLGMAADTVRDSVDAGKDRSLTAAIGRSRRTVRIVRMALIGDYGASASLARQGAQEAAHALSEGLWPVGYLHGWRMSPAAPLKGVLAASCPAQGG